MLFTVAVLSAATFFDQCHAEEVKAVKPFQHVDGYKSSHYKPAYDYEYGYNHDIKPYGYEHHDYKPCGCKHHEPYVYKPFDYENFGYQGKSHEYKPYNYEHYGYKSHDYNPFAYEHYGIKSYYQPDDYKPYDQKHHEEKKPVMKKHVPHKFDNSDFLSTKYKKPVLAHGKKTIVSKHVPHKYVEEPKHIPTEYKKPVLTHSYKPVHGSVEYKNPALVKYAYEKPANHAAP